MAITPVDKIRIMKFFKDNPIGEIYYLDLCDAIGKRGKIKDVEFLEFFVDSVISEFKKSDKISMKQVSKLVLTVDTFLEWVNNVGTEVSENLLDKIRVLDEYYEKYLDRTNFEVDNEFVNDYLTPLMKKIEELYPSKVVSESVLPYLNQIEELKNDLLSLRREFDNLSQLYGDLQKKYDKRCSEYLQKCEDNNKLSNSLFNKDKSINELEDNISSLTQQISDFENKVNEFNGQLDFYKPYKELYEKLLIEFNDLKFKLEEFIRNEEEQQRSEALDEHLINLIYMCLINGRTDINGIVNYLKRNEGICCDNKKVYSLLSKLKKKINIESDSFMIRPSYQIKAPEILQNGLFVVDVPYETDYCDILLVSDIHIKDFDSKTMNGFDAINNYCINNNINLVMSLGDFFDGVGGSRKFDYSCAMENYSIVEKAISVIPRCDGVYHAVLGGNHDRNILKYGFDPIKMFTDEREDFISLGYTHSTIAFNGFNGVIGHFDIHHPQTFDFPIDFSSSGVDTEKLNSYLDSVYNSIDRNREESYIDIFGHTHKSQFNFPESYCFIPSLFEGKNKKGACHLRVYFENDMDIKYMIFMPLSYNDKLIKNNEIVYKKMLMR
jgi:predicted phosphodiesterase